MKITVNKALTLALLTGIAVPAPFIAADTDTELPTRAPVLNLDTLSYDGLTELRVTGHPHTQHVTTLRPPEIGAAHTLSLTLDIPLTDNVSGASSGPWLTDNGISANAQQLIRAIQDSAVHGLNPEAYGLPMLLRTVDTLEALEREDAHGNTLVSTSFLAEASTLRQELEQQLNHAFVTLAEHLGQGVVDAESLQHRLYRAPPEINAKALLDAVFNGDHSVRSALKSVTPTHLEYQRLTYKMRDLLTEQATGVRRAAVESSNFLADSQIVNDVLGIQLRLIETGELPLSTELSDQWDNSTREALLAFQHRHGIRETGQADSRTRAALNLTIEQEIEAVALSLERWRWMPRALGQKHVFVNIPEYRVVVRDGAETLLSMNAVVGSVDHPTPAFSRDMSYMDFNPTWTVPASITNAKLIPLERRNPGYLTSRDFEYLQRQGRKLVKIPDEQVTAEDIQKPRFPYVLRQRGGSKNALGRMKFMMPNPYAIYLHDTPSKQHFTLNDRAFSHGCIRLGDPEALARLLMNEDGYSERAIASALAAKDTTRIKLRTPVPTHLTYMTTWVDVNNILHRRDDIYNHDAALIEALWRANTLVTTIKTATMDFASTESSL